LLLSIKSTAVEPQHTVVVVLLLYCHAMVHANLLLRPPTADASASDLAATASQLRCLMYKLAATHAGAQTTAQQADKQDVTAEAENKQQSGRPSSGLSPASDVQLRLHTVVGQDIHDVYPGTHQQASDELQVDEQKFTSLGLDQLSSAAMPAAVPLTAAQYASPGKTPAAQEAAEATAHSTESPEFAALAAQARDLLREIELAAAGTPDGSPPSVCQLAAHTTAQCSVDRLHSHQPASTTSETEQAWPTGAAPMPLERHDGLSMAAAVAAQAAWQGQLHNFMPSLGSVAVQTMNTLQQQEQGQQQQQRQQGQQMLWQGEGCQVAKDAALMDVGWRAAAARAGDGAAFGPDTGYGASWLTGKMCRTPIPGVSGSATADAAARLSAGFCSSVAAAQAAAAAAGAEREQQLHNQHQQPRQSQLLQQPDVCEATDIPQSGKAQVVAFMAAVVVHWTLSVRCADLQGGQSQHQHPGSSVACCFTQVSSCV
jgi:hypothetical protein